MGIVTKQTFQIICLSSFAIGVFVSCGPELERDGVEFKEPEKGIAEALLDDKTLTGAFDPNDGLPYTQVDDDGALEETASETPNTPQAKALAAQVRGVKVDPLFQPKGEIPSHLRVTIDLAPDHQDISSSSHVILISLVTSPQKNSGLPFTNPQTFGQNRDVFLIEALCLERTCSSAKLYLSRQNDPANKVSILFKRTLKRILSATGSPTDPKNPVMSQIANRFKTPQTVEVETFQVGRGPSKLYANLEVDSNQELCLDVDVVQTSEGGKPISTHCKEKEGAAKTPNGGPFHEPVEVSLVGNSRDGTFLLELSSGSDENAEAVYLTLDEPENSDSKMAPMDPKDPKDPTAPADPKDPADSKSTAVDRSCAGDPQQVIFSSNCSSDRIKKHLTELESSASLALVQQAVLEWTIDGPQYWDSQGKQRKKTVERRSLSRLRQFFHNLKNAPSPSDLKTIESYFLERKLDPSNLGILAIESEFFVSEVNAPIINSKSGARGPWQITDIAAVDINKMCFSFSRKDRDDLKLSSKAAACYLDWLYKEFNERPLIAIMAWNWGLGRIDRAQTVAHEKAKKAARKAAFRYASKVQSVTAGDILKLDMVPKETRDFATSFAALWLIGQSLKDYPMIKDASYTTENQKRNFEKSFAAVKRNIKKYTGERD